MSFFNRGVISNKEESGMASKNRNKNGGDEIPVDSEQDNSCQEAGVSSCTQTDVAMETDSNVSSEMAHLCDLDVSCASDTSTMNTSTGSSTNTSSSKYRCPPRAGIQWKKGEKIEAMDSFKKWYAAKFSDIDFEDRMVLIHFEGWNQRYDEWVPFDSERLRAMTRHSERKEGRRRQKREHRPGERVLAKWTDCKMYPAKVTDVKSDGSLEVVFYDGFKRIVQPINVRAIPQQYKQIVNSEFRKMENKAAAASRSKSMDDSEKKHNKTETRSRSNSRDGKEEIGSSSIPKTKEVRRRRRPALNVLNRRKLAMTKTLASQRSSGRKRAIREMKKAENRRKAHHKVFPKKRQRIPKKSPTTTAAEIKPTPPLSFKHVHTNKGEMRTKKRAISLPTTTDALKTPHPLPLTIPSTATIPKHQNEVLAASHVAPKAFKIEEDHNMYKCTHEGCTKSFRKENLLESHIKYYHLDDSKTAGTPAPRAKRRKTTSICSTDSDLSLTPGGKGTSTPNDPSPAVSPVKRRRNISSEVLPLASESPVNFGSPKETQTPHEITLPTFPKIKEELPDTFSSPAVAGSLTQDKKPMPSNDACNGVVKEQKVGVVKEEHVKHARSSIDSNVTEGSLAETEDEEDGNEIVNCLCGFFETDGLMIQCDICLCWQHALCLNLDKDSVPNNYVCFICENPPGIREGSQNVHNQEWLKTGHLPSFSFLNLPQSEESCEMMQATHCLVGDLHNIKAVLHGLQCQIKASEVGENREINLWYKDWDDPNAGMSADTTEEFHSVSVEESPVSTTPVDTHEPSSNRDTPVRFSLDIEQSSDLSVEHYKFQLPMATESAAQSLDNIDTASEASTMTASESSTSFMSSYPSFSNIQADGVTDSRGSDSLAVTDNGGQQDDDKQDVQNVTAPRKPVDKETMMKHCQRNLLLHVLRTQTEVNQRLDLIEEQVSVLEKGDNLESASEAPDTLHDIPVLKRSLHSLIRDLHKVKRMAAYH